MRRTIQLILAGIALSAVAAGARANCLPEGDNSVRGEFGRSEYVGVVRVVGVTWLDDERRPTKLSGKLMVGSIREGLDPYSGANYRVIPERTFKGRASRPLVIFSENTEGRTLLTLGARYLVFLQRQTVVDESRRVGDLMIDHCGNSAVLGRATRALVFLERPAEADRLEAFLRGYIGPEEEATAEVAYMADLVDLAGDGAPEVIVFLMGDAWCGSGGCTTLVLKREAHGYRLVSKITVTQLPIRVLRTRHHGWRDLGVSVGGGGVAPGEAVLAFDGRGYPTNPTVRPASRLRRAQGDILMDNDDPMGAIRAASGPPH